MGSYEDWVGTLNDDPGALLRGATFLLIFTVIMSIIFLSDLTLVVGGLLWLSFAGLAGSRGAMLAFFRKEKGGTLAFFYGIMSLIMFLFMRGVWNDGDGYSSFERGFLLYSGFLAVSFFGPVVHRMIRGIGKLMKGSG